VILAAGTIHSGEAPDALRHRNAEELKKLGIGVVATARSGRNLQDHVLVSGVVYKYQGQDPAAGGQQRLWRRKCSCR